MIGFAGTPATIELGAMLFVTTAPAPMHEPLPISISSTTLTPGPKYTLLPICAASGGVRPYSCKLAEVDIISDNSAWTDNEPVAMLYVEPVANHCTRWNKQTVATFITSCTPAGQRIEPTFAILSEPEPECKTDANPAPAGKPNAQHAVATAIMSERIRTNQFKTIAIAPRNRYQHLFA